MARGKISLARDVPCCAIFSYVFYPTSVYTVQNMRVCVCVCVCIQSVSRLYGIMAGGDFLGLFDQKSSHKHVSDFERLRSYDRFLIPVHALV